MIQQLLEETLLKDQEARATRKRSGKFSPSSFGKCYRAQYWNRKNEPVTNPPDIKGILKMLQGTWTHKMIQSLLPKEMVEVMIDTENVLGFADIVEKDAVTDIKSCEEFQYNRYHKIPTPTFFEKNKNMFIQTGWYAMELGIDTIIVRSNIFGTFTHCNHIVPLSNVIGDIKAELNTLNALWEGDKLPIGIPRCYNGKECGYCNYKLKCDEVNNGQR